MIRRFILTTFIIFTCFNLLQSGSAFAGSAVIDETKSFTGPWQYQWGDSEMDNNGQYTRLLEPLNSPGWQTIATPADIIDRNGKDVLWIRTVVQTDHCTNCALYAESIDQVFELYADQRLITKIGAIHQGTPVVYAGAPLNLYSIPNIQLPNGDHHSVLLTLRIQSDQNNIGLLGPIYFGEYSLLAQKIMQSYWIEVFFGLTTIFMSFISLVFAIRMRSYDLFGKFALFSFTLGIYLCISTRIIQFVYPEPLFFGYLEIILAHLVPIVFYLYMISLIGKGKWNLNQYSLIFQSIVSGICALAVYFGAVQIHQTLEVLQLACLVTLVTILVGLLFRKDKLELATKRFTVGFVAFMLTGIHDVLVGLNVLPYQFYIGFFGWFILVSYQMYILFSRIADANSRSDEYAAQLEHHTQLLNDQHLQLQNYSSILEDRTRELNAKNEELLKMNDIKDQILANTSHELRTPINGIIGIAESMTDNLQGDPNAEMRRNLRMIVSSGRRLSNLVNDILDYSRMRNNQLTLRIGKVDVNIVAQMVIDLCRPLVGSKLIELRNDLEPDFPLINADENRMHQILYNLVSNSIKFTPSGEVAISGKRVGDHVEISVRDTGIGIPREKQNHIFESFEQVDGSVAREFGGTGLGLAVTKQLVELQGGEIWVDSEIHHYTAFTFQIPLYLETEISNVMREGTQVGNRMVISADQLPDFQINHSKLDTEGEYNVLIVDDEPLNLQVIINHLMPLNYGITTASDGIEALAYLHSGKQYDLVLLDVMMPRMSGYEVCERIRQKFQANELPVIILTAKNSTEDLVKGFQVGANDYLPKPFARQELISRIQTHLKLTRQHRSLKVMKERLEQLLDRRNETY